MNVPIFSKTGYDKLQEIMSLANELENKVEFDVLVDTTIAKKVVEEYNKN